MSAKKKSGNQNRRYPLMPKPAIFKKRTNYDRKREKEELRNRLMKEE